MPWNGSGVYSAPSSPGAFNPAQTGGTADPTSWNNLLSDLTGTTGLTNAICRDGQSTITANISLNNFKITSLGSALNLTDAPQTTQVQNNTFVYSPDTGAADAYVMTLVPVLTGYAIGQVFWMKVANTNLTTTPTLAVNGLTAGTIEYANGSAVKAGDIKAAAVVGLIVGQLSGPTPTFYLIPPQPSMAINQSTTGPTIGNITTPGSGTYTTPAGCVWFRLRMVGGGGGGGGTGSSIVNGGAGGASVFGGLAVNGGGGGTGASGAAPGTGGLGGTGGSGSAQFRLSGAQGGDGAFAVTGPSGAGASSTTFSGGAGARGGGSSANGYNAVGSTGAGGSGAYGYPSFYPAGGGGSGEYVEHIVVNPSATYSYTIGTGGAGGVGTVQTGGNGAAGLITIEAHFNY